MNEYEFRTGKKDRRISNGTIFCRLNRVFKSENPPVHRSTDKQDDLVMGSDVFDSRKLARELCSKLISHLTSVQNVEMIAMALRDSRTVGRNEIYDSLKRPDYMDRMDGG